MSGKVNEPKASTMRSPGLIVRRIARLKRPLGLLVAVVAVGVLLGAAYVAGSPAGQDTHQQRYAGGPEPMPAATMAPAAVPIMAGTTPGLSEQKAVLGGVITGGDSSVTDLAALSTDKQIVKTGSMSMEVSSLDNALAQAESAIVGLGGSVSDSNQSGSGEQAAASVTYRVPVARWDDAIKAIRGLGKLLSQQTGTNDVTSQVIDLEARLTNLQATESALQGIMARASAIPDVLAVQTQLTQTRGEIEQLTAQRDYLKNQAAMSTLSVAFTLPGKTVTTQASQDWTLGNQVDEAAAALVRIGQGLATMAVWAVIVGLPAILGLLILYVLFRIGRRVARRRSPRQGTATSA